MKKLISTFFLTTVIVTGTFAKQANTISVTTRLDTATFAEGCFWCTEALFEELKGVVSVSSGYSGGTTKNPTYADVCSGQTGHAESCQITFDSKVISFTDLLEVFWKTHDPTTLNRQGHDEGTQYRSAVFYHNTQQKMLAEKYKKELDASGAYSSPITTEITHYKNFYVAENYHQDYFALNGKEPYCQMVIQPKVDKFQKVFKAKLKTTTKK
jgi:peptide-methionine (S)-S-oxide reductase